MGKLTLNKNPSDYFTEIEQAAFSPAHMIPGVEPSPDKMLHGRLFAYGDTHRHRLGANYRQISVNQPIVNVTNYQRDGHGTTLHIIKKDMQRSNNPYFITRHQGESRIYNPAKHLRWKSFAKIVTP